MKNKLIALLFGLIFLICSQVNVNAMDSISLIYPNTQKDGAINYFHLMYQEGKEDKIGFNLYNDSDKEMTYLVSINKGITNENGIITFDEKELSDDSNESENFISIPKTVTIGAKESKEVIGTIKYPNKKFAGSQLSGLTIKPLTVEGSSSIEFVYPIITQGVLLEKKNPIEVKGFDVDNYDNKAKIIVPFKNQENKWTKEAEYTIKVTHENREIFNKSEPLEIASNSDGKLIVPLDVELQKGKNIITIEINTPWGTTTNEHIEKVKGISDKTKAVIFFSIFSIVMIVLLIDIIWEKLVK